MAKPFLSTLVSLIRRSSPRTDRDAPDIEGAQWLEETLAKNYAMDQAIGMRDGRPVFSDWSTARAVKDGMKSSVWVYRCADLGAKSVASVPLKVVDIEDEEIDSPLSDLLAKPNGYWTTYVLMQRMMLMLFLGGNALVWKNRGGRPAPAPVLELWLIHPDQIKPVVSSSDVISHYEFRDGNGKRKTIPREDIVHLQFVDPVNPYWGLSVIKAAARTIDTEIEAQTWNKVAMQNRAVSDGMISFRRPLSREQWLEARYRAREMHMGSQNARAPWVMGDDARWIGMQMSPVEMDFIESRKMGRVEICAAFGTPPVLVGDQEYSTYDNYSTARLSYWEDTVVPWIVMVEQALTLGLAGDFGLPAGARVLADLSANRVLNQITPDKISVAQGLHSMGVPFSEINERLDLRVAEFAGWDVSYLPSGVSPASEMAMDPFAVMGEAQVAQLAEILTQRRKLLSE